jgi:threonylcarbamoyladenosine tRNA methylthiotransferase MtaB
MRIYLDTIGCRLNQSEIETYAWQFRDAGHSLTATPENADLVVINTCTVTAAAASDSRQKIRQAARLGAKQIILTGCWSTLNPEEAANLPGVSSLVSNQEKDRLVTDLLHVPQESFDLEPVARELVPGARLRTRAFIKVQDGCDNCCTYCITTLARGSCRSRPINEILKDIHRATRETALDGATSPTRAAPAQEIVLTGVHLGAWGQDFSPPQHLRHMVRAILEDTDVARLRLSSLEPWDLTEEFFNLWGDPRLCRHLHLPLQSGSDAVLRRMARKTTHQAYAEFVRMARQAIPEVAITTDIIVGFPGESEAEFKESLEFVREMQFARGHVFSYSARPGTAAAKMPDQVSHALYKERNKRMRTVLAESETAYLGRFIGQVLPVLWEATMACSPEGWHINGLTGNYMRVHALAAEPLWNQITLVKLVKRERNGLSGVICSTPFEYNEGHEYQNATRKRAQRCNARQR